MLFNNDAEAAPGWLAAIDQTFRERPEISSVASRIMLYDRRNVFHTTGDYYKANGVPGNRGVWQEDKGQYDQAIADYSEAIRLNPRLAVAFNNRCLTRAVTGKNLVDALHDCDEALKLSPGNIDALDTRGFIQLKLGDFKTAINEYNASLQIDANHARALYGRGLAVKHGASARLQRKLGDE